MMMRGTVAAAAVGESGEEDVGGVGFTDVLQWPGGGDVAGDVAPALGFAGRRGGWVLVEFEGWFEEVG